MAKQDRVLTNRKRKVFRKHIPTYELVSGVVVVGALVAAGVWVAAQKDNYDPGERDISAEVMDSSATEDTLYQAPLKLWAPPNQRQGGGPNLGIFPQDVVQGAWEPSSRLQEFDPDTLYEKINGAAEQYLQFGFEKLHYISLANRDDDIELGMELYDMGAFKNALGIFASQSSAENTVENMDGAIYYTTPVGAVAVFGKYYFRLSGNGPDAQEKALEVVPVVAQAVAGSEELPAPFRMLTEAGVAFDDIAYEKTNVFQFAFAEDFWFGKADGDMRYYVHQAADTDAAQALYDKLFEGHTDYDYTVVSEEADAVLLKHKFLDTFLSLEHDSGLVYGVEYAPDAETAREAVAKLEKALTYDRSTEET
ncbi:MAG: DUF6599 family protein [Candidatus Hydrogenedentota bacterium]